MFSNTAYTPARFGENIRLTRPLSHELYETMISVFLLFSQIAIAPRITRVTKYSKRWDMFSNTAYTPARFGENIRLTRPLSHELYETMISVFLLFSHTLTVVPWPKIGHSTTLNNKGYETLKRWDMFRNLARIPS